MSSVFIHIQFEFQFDVINTGQVIASCCVLEILIKGLITYKFWLYTRASFLYFLEQVSLLNNKVSSDDAIPSLYCINDFILLVCTYKCKNFELHCIYLICMCSCCFLFSFIFQNDEGNGNDRQVIL